MPNAYINVYILIDVREKGEWYSESRSDTCWVPVDLIMNNITNALDKQDVRWSTLRLQMNLYSYPGSQGRASLAESRILLQDSILGSLLTEIKAGKYPPHR